MSVTDSTIPATPVEYDEESDTIRCAVCGTPASQVQRRAEWSIVCAAPIDPPDERVYRD